MAIELNDYTKLKCRENGGTEEWYVYDICDREDITITDGVITALTMKDGTKAVKWTPDMESGNMTETTTGSRENNSVMNAQSGLVIFKDDEDVTVDIVDQVSRAVGVGVIIKKATADGSFKARHYGVLNGLSIETVEGTLGQLYEDLRGHTLNFTGKELGKAPSIDETIVDSILIPAS